MKILNKLTMPFIFAAFFLMLLLPHLAFADTLANGIAAYKNNDCKTAFEIIKPLAESGDAKAQHLLSAFYATGCGVSQDINEAMRWILKAAAQGDPESFENLGDIYRAGDGVEADMVESYKYYLLADMFGQIEDEAEMDDISRKMTAAQVAEAKSKAAAWLADHPKLQRPVKRYSILLFLAMFVVPAIFAAKFIKTQHPTLFYFRLFVWIAFFMLIGLPAYFVISKSSVSALQPLTLVNAAGWAAFATAACIYAADRCYTKSMPYYDAMIFVSYSTSLWGMSASIMATMPVLLFVCTASVIMSASNDILGQPEKTPQQFSRLLAFVFRNRTQQ